jgi:uncharacterized membrane protein
MATGAPHVKSPGLEQARGDDTPRMGLVCRYHAGAITVLASGIVGGIVAIATGFPVWAGFLVVSVPVHLVTAMAYAVDED